MKRALFHLSAGCISLAMSFLLAMSWAETFAQKEGSPTVPKSWTYDELAKAPLKEKGKLNPLEHDPEAVAAGSKLFENHCAECHGSSAEGTKDGPSLRVSEVQQATPGTLFWLLTNGVVRRGMPVWSKLPEPQRWQIIGYLKSLGKTVATGK